LWVLLDSFALPKKFGDTLKEPMVDEFTHPFDDWFADAAKD
jgi:hypothetical protein